MVGRDKSEGHLRSDQRCGVVHVLDDGKVNGLHKAAVNRGVTMAAGEHGALTRETIAIGADCAGSGEGWNIANRSSEIHRVLARGQIAEAIGSGATGGDRSDWIAVCIGRDRRGAACIEKRDKHSGEAAFAAVLDAVAIGVVPDKIAEADGLIEATVNPIVILTGGEHRALPRETIAIGADGSGSGKSRHITARRGELHRVLTDG